MCWLRLAIDSFARPGRSGHQALLRLSIPRARFTRSDSMPAAWAPARSRSNRGGTADPYRLTCVTFTEAEPHSLRAGGSFGRVALWDGHCVELSRSQSSRRSGSLGQLLTTRDTVQELASPCVHATRSGRRPLGRSGEKHLDRGSKRWSTRLSMAGDRVRATCLCFTNESGCTGGTWRCRSSAAWRGRDARGPAMIEVPAGTWRCRGAHRRNEPGSRGPACSRSQLGRDVAGRAQRGGEWDDPGIGLARVAGSSPRRSSSPTARRSRWARSDARIGARRATRARPRRAGRRPPRPGLT
jgi:hypothetical protein